MRWIPAIGIMILGFIFSSFAHAQTPVKTIRISTQMAGEQLEMKCGTATAEETAFLDSLQQTQATPADGLVLRWHRQNCMNEFIKANIPRGLRVDEIEKNAQAGKMFRQLALYWGQKNSRMNSLSRRANCPEMRSNPQARTACVEERAGQLIKKVPLRAAVDDFMYTITALVENDSTMTIEDVAEMRLNILRQEIAKARLKEKMPQPTRPQAPSVTR